MFVGNNLSNSIWEASILSNYKKPDCNSNYSEREKFIRAKYEQRLFLNPPYNENLSIKDLLHWKELLLQSCENNNYYNLLNSIAHDMNLHLSFSHQNNQLNQFTQQSEEIVIPNNNGVNKKEKYPLHIAIKHGSLTCVYFLVMNGFDILQRDENGLSSIEIAEKYEKYDIASYLRKRSELIRIRQQNLTPSHNSSSTNHHQQISEAEDLEENEQEEDQQEVEQDHHHQQHEKEELEVQNNEHNSEIVVDDNNNPNDDPNDNNIRLSSLGVNPDNPFDDDDLKMI